MCVCGVCAVVCDVGVGGVVGGDVGVVADDDDADAAAADDADGGGGGGDVDGDGDYVDVCGCQ